MDAVLPFLYWYLPFIVGIACHEGAHAWVAWRLGDPTAYEGGQATINPLPHMRREPIGTIVLPLLSFFSSGFMIGFAWVPVDAWWSLRNPRRAAMVALAGPLATLGLALLALIGIKVGLAAGVFELAPGFEGGWLRDVAERGLVVGEGVWGNVARLASIMFLLQGVLLVFNLLPFPPLDGGTVVTLLMDRDTAARFMAFAREWSMVGMLAAWLVFREVGWPVVEVLIGFVH